MTKPTTRAHNKEQREADIPVLLYDAEARNRLGYVAESGGLEYDTVIWWSPLADTRYMQWIREFNLKGQAENLGVNEQSMEATVRLFDEQADEMENIEVDSGEDWRTLVPISEKIDAVNNWLAVSAFTSEEKATGPRKLSSQTTRIVLTEAYFDSSVLRQTHTIRLETIEWKKKYAQIQSKRFKQEITRGLRRKPKVEFVPQNERLGELYDEMQVSSTGFVGDIIPLRFKTAVIEFIFESELTPQEKK